MTDLTILDPPLVAANGDPVADPRDEDAIEASLLGQAPEAYATAGLPPLGWNQGRPDGSRMVGWTLHRRGSSQILDQHAFSINPQAITRSPSNRNQMFATQAGFYVDDFGAGSETIQLTQLVAHGRASVQAGGGLTRATMRDDVVRFYDAIYTRASSNPGQYDVYFHDNHLWPRLSSRAPELVYFPAQSWQLVRSVSLHNVWQVSLTMMTLTAAPSEAAVAPSVPGKPRYRLHIVREGETLTKIAARLAARGARHHHASHKQVLAVQQQIIALTKKYGKDDITKTRTLTIAASPGSSSYSQVTVTRMHLAVGETILIPAG